MGPFRARLAVRCMDRVGWRRRLVPVSGARVTTGTGDDGYTGLMGEGRVAKHAPRIVALGDVDEATSALGLARSLTPTPRVRDVIVRLQRELYQLMAELATTAEALPQLGRRVSSETLAGLETLQDELRAEVNIPHAFIIPGATQSSAALDVARAVVRRAERAVWGLLEDGELDNADVARYLNRCSDLLHILARYDEVSQGVDLQLQG